MWHCKVSHQLLLRVTCDTVRCHTNYSYVWHVRPYNVLFKVKRGHMQQVEEMGLDTWMNDDCQHFKQRSDVTAIYSYVWHDFWLMYICVTRLVYTERSCWLWKEWVRGLEICLLSSHYTALISFQFVHTCGMSYAYVWHNSFMCVTWLFHMCGMILITGRSYWLLKEWVRGL